MRIRKYPLWAVVTTLMSFLLVQGVNATTTGLGLDWREQIFVQEFWLNHRPYYTMTNLRNGPAAIGVYDRYGNKLLAGPWTVAPQSVSYVGVSALLGQNLVRFELMDGTFLGLLEAPKPATTVDKRSFATYNGLNGSGGRSANLYSWC